MGEITDNYLVGIPMGEFACGQTHCSVVQLEIRHFRVVTGQSRNSFMRVWPSPRTIKIVGNGGLRHDT